MSRLVMGERATPKMIMSVIPIILGMWAILSILFPRHSFWTSFLTCAGVSICTATETEWNLTGALCSVFGKPFLFFVTYL